MYTLRRKRGKIREIYMFRHMPYLYVIYCTNTPLENIVRFRAQCRESDFQRGKAVFPGMHLDYRRKRHISIFWNST